MEQNQEVVIAKEKGLEIQRYFSKEGADPFEMFVYEKRSSIIKDPDGSLVFQMTDVEVPSFWTQVSTDILAQKYLRKSGVPLKNENGEPLLNEAGEVITGSENSIKQVAHRIAGCWRQWAEKFDYFASEKDAQIFYEEMVYMIINQVAAPNSPQWFTTGLNWAYGITGPAQGHSYVDPVTKKLEFSKDAYTRSQPHACFIQSVNDDLVRPGGIFSLLTREARIFKYGSGSGSNFSNLRANGEQLSGGGNSSGLMSFLKIFDTAAGSIKSGGTTRRAAKMVCLDLDHPEVENFIWWKVREEEKVASLVAGSKILKRKLSSLIELAKNKVNLLEDKEVCKALKLAAKDHIPVNYIVRALDLAKQGYDLPLQEFNTHYESGAYVTVSGQNSNNSIRIPNKFFECLNKDLDWAFKARTTGEVTKTINAKKLWDDIGYCAWASADPGVQFDTTINEWHTCPEDGRINASNPCSEYMFLDDTACNLGSINLAKFYDANTGVFDVVGYKHTIRLWAIALELSVLMAHFPSEEMAVNSYKYRALGLGFANLGTLLMLQGIPYDSNKGRTIASALTAIMTGEVYSASAELAKVLGPFERFEANKEHMLKVIRNHRQAVYDMGDYENLTIKPMAIKQDLCPLDLLQATHDSWDRALELGEKYGYRNAQATVLAPTGTIGLVMDCDTTGVEPDYALVKLKKLAGGGFFKIVNQSVPKALSRLGYRDQQIEAIINYCQGHATLEGSPYINSESLKEKGLNQEQLVLIEQELKNCMDVRLVFNKWVVGESFYNEVMRNKEGSFLNVLGFSDQEIATTNEYICGAMTIEGAPHLKEEHYAVFDCANKCGNKGQRYIDPYGHLKMVAAVQPFLSGAISKTINMPKEWTVKQIKQIYYDAWTMMTKAVALYRDCSKLSQPLTATLEEYPELKELLEESLEEELPLNTITRKVMVGPRELLLTAMVENSKLSSIDLRMGGMTPTQEAMVVALVNSVNLGLQNDLSPSIIVAQSLNVEGHPVIKELRSFLDEFSNQPSSPLVQKCTSCLTKEGVEEKKVIINENPEESVKCKGCGASQLRRNGTCLLCEVCGDTTGCS